MSTMGLFKILHLKCSGNYILETKNTTLLDRFKKKSYKFKASLFFVSEMPSS